DGGDRISHHPPVHSLNPGAAVARWIPMELGISRVCENLQKGGHEMTAASHVGDKMEASAAATTVAHDPIGDLIVAGQHREAVATCARNHHVVLGRLCMALLGSQADADEAVQETLLRAHRAMATYR